jgi:mannose-6-phosphate isomerase-like protein (cupin superfamily)
MKPSFGCCPGLMLFLLAGLVPASAQSKVAEVYSLSQLIQMAQPLVQQASKGNGTATRIIEKYPDHYTMLVYRNRDGGAELHRDFADIFVMVEGKATLVSGGEIVNPMPSGEGEIRGASVTGTRMELTKEDVVHIAAGVPHQVLVPANSSVIYYVIKVETTH